jgi:hypothetical protein
MAQASLSTGSRSHLLPVSSAPASLPVKVSEVVTHPGPELCGNSVARIQPVRRWGYSNPTSKMNLKNLNLSAQTQSQILTVLAVGSAHLKRATGSVTSPKPRPIFNPAALLAGFFMFRMNGMPRAQGCAGAACVSFARHIDKQICKTRIPGQQ